MSEEKQREASEIWGNGYSEDVIRAFVGKNADYYIDKWKHAKDPAKRSGWNWAAFLAGAFWLGYRKMYKIILIILGLFIAIDILQLFIVFDLNRGVNLGITAVLCGSGNSLYYNHMNRRIKELHQGTGNENELAELVKAAGGASWIGVGIALLLFIAYIIVTSIIGIILEILFI